MRVRAVNTAPDSENPMHDDAVARTYGFEGGGLVTGVDVFEYLVRGLLLEGQDPGWLSPGRGGELRLLRPYYDGEEVAVHWDGNAVWAGDRAVLSIGAKSAGETEPEPQYAGLPVERPAASEASLAAGTVLGSLRRELVYGEEGGSVKARELLELANEILMRNVVLDPWIHTGSKIRWLEGIEAVRSVELRGRVKSEFERKGHRLVTLDLSYRDLESGLAVARIEHTAIWRYCPR